MNQKSMNPVLENKIHELENAQKAECWYLVKQTTDFCTLCYMVSFLEQYKKSESTDDIDQYLKNKIEELKKTNPDIDISNPNYRALKVAAYFGLFTMNFSQYTDVTTTPTFEEITTKCNGRYENIDCYKDVIKRQIEKMFISTELDTQYEKIRQNYRLYPIMLLYKVLIELGHTSGEYKISMDEYRYLVATTSKFEDFLSTLLLITLLREDNTGAINSFQTYKDKLDNRMILVLKQLDTLVIEQNSISLNLNKLNEVAQKVFAFEQNPRVFETDDYFEFLGSTKSLFDLVKSDGNSFYNTNVDIPFDRNRIVFGAPGTGKSYTLRKDCEQIIKNGGDYERVTFHPDYSYSQFVGTYKPIMDDDGKTIKYEYVPGPFMRVLVNALKSTKKGEPKPFVLIIEEINRAKVAGVFGDVFQLLDRDENGVSEYEIQTSEDIRKYLAKTEVLGGSSDDYKKLRIPNNMFIWATMNSADQGVFPVDTAFKRRWAFEYIGINEKEDKIKNTCIICLPPGNERIEWNALRKAINDKMSSQDFKVNEDKLMGPFFLSKRIIDKIKNKGNDPKTFTEVFMNKVIMYIYEDAVKQKRNSFFDGCPDTSKYSSVCDFFKSNGLEIFGKNFKAEYYDKYKGEVKGDAKDEVQDEVEGEGEH